MQQSTPLLAWKAFVNENICVGCGKCTGVCWTGAIGLVNKKAVVDFSRCICCTACVRACPKGAIQIAPYPYPILHRDQVLERIKTQLNVVRYKVEEMERSIGEM